MVVHFLDSFVPIKALHIALADNVIKNNIEEGIRRQAKLTGAVCAVEGRSVEVR